MKGAHGLQPDGHEHARCRFCRREDVHVRPVRSQTTGAPEPDAVIYDAHNERGTSFPCAKSRGQIVMAEDRHRPAPEARP